MTTFQNPDHQRIADQFAETVRDFSITAQPEPLTLHRHLFAQRKGTRVCSFGIVTWPGYLAFYGDMGTFVFTRLTDMFEFFRGDVNGSIDLRYWAEKCEAADSRTRGDGIEEYSAKVFRESVEYQFKQVWEGHEGPDREAAFERLNDEVLSHSDDEHYSLRAAYEFSDKGPDPEGYRWQLCDGDMVSHMDYTYRFVWCCCALRWAIDRYDRGIYEVAS